MSNLLSERLQKVYSLAVSDNGNRLIDVGSDHGHLALNALKSGDFKSVLCTDIHKDPAEKTRMCLYSEGYKDNAEVYCTDGLNGVDLMKDDVVVMAGLGGNNIVDIMKRAYEITPVEIIRTVTWCLQPQKSIEVLRTFLADNGFRIITEEVSVDRGIYYPMIKTQYNGEKYTLNLKEKFYGPVLLTRDDDPVTKEFFLRLDDRYALRSRGDAEVKKMMEG